MGEFDTAMMVMERTHLTASDLNSIIAFVDFEESKGLSERVIKLFPNIYRNRSGNTTAEELDKENVFYNG